MTADAGLAALLREAAWFHAIDFGAAGASAGRFGPQRPPNHTLYGVLRFLESIELAGMHCLDVGTMDGLVAFCLKQAGAARVTATDLAERATFHAGRNHLGLEIDYLVPARIDQIAARVGDAPFDLIVCAGVLYHVFDPLAALVSCRELLALDGLLILETQFRPHEARPLIWFSPADARTGSIHANTFFQPSASALVGMLEVAGFEVVASIAVGARLTVLARAGRPGEMATSTPMVGKIQRSYANYANYGERIDYAALAAQTRRSTIRYRGTPGVHGCIHASAFRTRFALQPAFDPGSWRRVRLRLAEGLGRLRGSWARRRWLPAIDRPLDRP